MGWFGQWCPVFFNFVCLGVDVVAEAELGLDMGRSLVGRSDVGSGVAHRRAPLESRRVHADRPQSVDVVHVSGARRELARPVAAQSRFALVRHAAMGRQQRRPVAVQSRNRPGPPAALGAVAATRSGTSSFHLYMLMSALFTSDFLSCQFSCVFRVPLISLYRVPHGDSFILNFGF